MAKNKVYVGLGVMSGTSLDGLDLCCVEFSCTREDSWSYNIIKAVTIQYSQEWRDKLICAPDTSSLGLIQLHVEYGHYLGQVVQEFLNDVHVELKVKVDFVACHGHTIFHQPEDHMTFQLGCGETTVSHLTCPLVCDFRTKDVALGGQGAPLVPFGEKFLFAEYDMCLNLGGIANISVKKSCTGYDVCVCNMLLNHVSKMVDRKLEYDKDGCLARGGNLDQDILDRWNQIEYYSQAPPKSIGREWFEQCFLPTITSYSGCPANLLRTCVAHISEQITEVLARETTPGSSGCMQRLLVTGGGALNNFLVEQLRSTISSRGLDVLVEVVNQDLVEYKEALVFAFLGLRTLRGEGNVNHSVTGALRDCVGGSIHLPPDGLPNIRLL